MPDPSINTVYDEKKILGCCVEKYGDNQIALCPKCYTIWNNDVIDGHNELCSFGCTKSLKLKGVSLKTNNIVSSDYKDIIDHQCVKSGKNINLQMNAHMMSKITINKNALTGFHNKMIVLENQSCAPFIYGLYACDYEVHDEDKLKDDLKNVISDDTSFIESLVELNKNHDVTQDSLKRRLFGHYHKTFHLNKFGQIEDEKYADDQFDSCQTGRVLYVNEVKQLGIIDIDIDKSLGESERWQIQCLIMKKLNDDDLVVVRSGSGGLHIYVNNDFNDLRKNANVKCYIGEGFDIDYMCNSDKCKSQACIMLPGSFNQKGMYKFVKGNYDSVIKHSATDVLKMLGIELDLAIYEASPDGTSESTEFFFDDNDNADDDETIDPEYEKLLMNGLQFNTIIHNFGVKLDDELTLFTLFQAINALSSDNRERAYQIIHSSCKFTSKALDNFYEMKDQLIGRKYRISVLTKIIRLYNNEYYQQHLVNKA